MPDATDYPRSLAEVLATPMRFKRATVEAVVNFARHKPWRGSVDERQAKFQTLHAEFFGIYGKRTTLTFGVIDGGCSGRSYYSPVSDEIVLIGKLSVVSMLHEWGHVLHGRSELRACRWSVQLFARCFPRSFSRCVPQGHMLRAATPQH